jgi:hypothetical protein
MNDEIAALVAAAARLPAAERRELIEAIADTLARLPHGDHLDRLIESDPAVMLRPFGLAAGTFTVPDDFDSPLPPEVLQEFQGR